MVIAVAVALKPDVLLLDEPTSALDPESARLTEVRDHWKHVGRSSTSCLRSSKQNTASVTASDMVTTCHAMSTRNPTTICVSITVVLTVATGINCHCTCAQPQAGTGQVLSTSRPGCACRRCSRSAARRACGSATTRGSRAAWAAASWSCPPAESPRCHSPRPTRRSERCSSARCRRPQCHSPWQTRRSERCSQARCRGPSLRRRSSSMAADRPVA